MSLDHPVTERRNLGGRAYHVMVGRQVCLRGKSETLDHPISGENCMCHVSQEQESKSKTSPPLRSGRRGYTDHPIRGECCPNAREQVGKS